MIWNFISGLRYFERYLYGSSVLTLDQNNHKNYIQNFSNIHTCNFNINWHKVFWYQHWKQVRAIKNIIQWSPLNHAPLWCYGCGRPKLHHKYTESLSEFYWPIVKLLLHVHDTTLILCTTKIITIVRWRRTINEDETRGLSQWLSLTMVTDRPDRHRF